MDYREAKKMAEEAQDQAQALFSKEKLSKEEEIQLISAASAALFLWARAGTALQVARSHWLASRAFVRVKEAKLALQHAQLCDFYTKKAGDRKDFDEAYAMEAWARAYALKGDLEQAQQYLKEAQELGSKIRDPEEKLKFDKELRLIF